MSDNPIHHAAALLEGAHQRSLELAGDDLLSPWATLATRTALVVSLLSPAATAITPYVVRLCLPRTCAKPCACSQHRAAVTDYPSTTS